MIKQILDNLKITALNEMQNASIEATKKGNDVVLLSPTGSGKTLAFLIPVLNTLDKQKTGIQAMILAPSRELAIQIEQVFKQMGTGFKVNCCYGGHAMKIEKNNLQHPPAVIIGTPGRLVDHIRRGTIDPTTIQTLVMDEFDKALEFGFEEDMSFIIGRLRNLKQRILTSATYSEEIPPFTGIKNAIELNYLSDKPIKGLKLKSILSQGEDKLNTLFRLICKLGESSTLIFCNHRDAVERISIILKEQGIIHDIFHGGMEQEDRERALIKFRNGSHRILITTDLASRGLDIPEVENVIHYQLPATANAFVHRNGRTARMHAEGTAFLILNPGEAAPEYITEAIEYDKLPEKTIVPSNSDWATLYIAAGRKDKINKMDIVGLLLQKGGLEKDELGLIEVLDFSSYAAVSRNKIEKVVQAVKNEKIKKKAIRMEVSR
jgi:superfamily II DNA/RNA helicase